MKPYEVKNERKAEKTFTKKQKIKTDQKALKQG